MLKTIIISKVLTEFVQAYVNIRNVQHHKAVQFLNSGHCYVVATMAQYVLKERYDIKVNLMSHCHHSFIEYEGRHYDTIFPTGYPLDIAKVWKLEEAACRTELDHLEEGSCLMVNPSISLLAWMEYICHYYMLPEPDVCNQVEEHFFDKDTFKRVNSPRWKTITKNMFRRKIGRYRGRAWKFRNQPLHNEKVWFARFTAYPEDLWVTLDVYASDYLSHFTWKTQAQSRVHRANVKPSKTPEVFYINHTPNEFTGDMINKMFAGITDLQELMEMPMTDLHYGISEERAKMVSDSQIQRAAYKQANPTDRFLKKSNDQLMGRMTPMVVGMGTNPGLTAALRSIHAASSVVCDPLLSDHADDEKRVNFTDDAHGEACRKLHELRKGK